MLKTHWRFISYIERFGDNVIIICSFLLAYYARDLFLRFVEQRGLALPAGIDHLAPLKDYLVVLGIALPLFNILISMLGGYRSMRFMKARQIFRLAFMSAGVVFLCVGSLLFLLKLDLSRSFVGLFCGLSAMCLFLERFSVLQLLRYWRIRGKNFRNALIVGTGAQARKIYLELIREPELGVRIVGFVTLDKGGLKADSEIYDLPARIVADEKSFESVLKRFAVDEVFFTDALEHFSKTNEMAQIAAEEGVGVTLAADFFSLELSRSDISYFRSVPLIHYHSTPVDNAGLVVKRIVDITLSSILIVVLSPILCLTALAIKLDSPGPVLFCQRRVGLNGRIFTLLKFRSMVHDAEKLLPNLKNLNEMEGPVFKLRNDPRVTRVGWFVRRFSIDELPQLLNVIKGDMSLVGPRPPLPEEVSLYMRKQRRRLSMRPGMTCIWQVSGRNEIPDFEHWAKLDLEYIDNWSLASDFRLMLRTIPVVISGFGAR